MKQQKLVEHFLSFLQAAAPLTTAELSLAGHSPSIRDKPLPAVLSTITPRAAAAAAEMETTTTSPSRAEPATQTQTQTQTQTTTQTTLACPEARAQATMACKELIATSKAFSSQGCRNYALMTPLT